MKWISWLGRMTPKERAKREVEELDRSIYDAEQLLHIAKSNLRHLTERRSFLTNAYDANPEPDAVHSELRSMTTHSLAS